jgi:site-specific recombinase XerD
LTPYQEIRITPKAIWHMMKEAAKRAGIKDLAPHDKTF